MKIECKSCGALYKIRDEKVQGKKVFKIRCKKCGDDIIVRGVPQEADEPPPSGRTVADSSDAEWHVVINGDRMGPFMVAELGAFWARGDIDAGSFVWRDSFEEWLPIEAVAGLTTLILASSLTPAAPLGPTETVTGLKTSMAGVAAERPSSPRAKLRVTRTGSDVPAQRKEVHEEESDVDEFGERRAASARQKWPIIFSGVGEAVPSEIREVISRCLDPNPDQRFRDFREIRALVTKYAVSRGFLATGGDAVSKR